MTKKPTQYTPMRRVAYVALATAAVATAGLLMMTVTWLRDMPIGWFAAAPYIVVVVGVALIVVAYHFYSVSRNIFAVMLSVVIIVTMAWCSVAIYRSDQIVPWLRTVGVYRAAQWQTTSPMDSVPQGYMTASPTMVPSGFHKVRRYISTQGVVRMYEGNETFAGATIIVVETPLRKNDDALMARPSYTLRGSEPHSGMRPLMYRNHDLQRNSAQRSTFYAHVRGPQTLVSVYFSNIPEGSMSYYDMETIVRGIIAPMHAL